MYSLWKTCNHADLTFAHFWVSWSELRKLEYAGWPDLQSFVRGHQMEGIWYAHFKTGESNGVGVAVLHNGQIEGGDPAHTYSGSYQEEGPNLYANVRVSPYAGSSLPADLTHPITYFLRRIGQRRFSESDWASQQQAGGNGLCRTSQGRVKVGRHFLSRSRSSVQLLDRYPSSL